MFKLIKFFNKKDYSFIVLAIGLIVLQVWLDLKLPEYMSQITRLVQTEGSEMSEIIKNGGLMMGCALGSLASAFCVGYLFSVVSASFSRNARREIYHKVSSLSTADIKKFSVSSLITRTTNDVTQVRMFFSMGLQMLIKSPITAVWAISKISGKSWQWGLATAIAVVLLLILVVIVMIVVVPKFKRLQKITDRLNNVTRENLTGIRVVRAFNAEQYQEDKFDDVNKDLTGVQLFTQRSMAILQPTMTTIMHGVNLSIYIIGAYLISSSMMLDKLTVFSDMVVFSSYAMQVIISFLMLVMIFMIMPRAQVSAARINEIMDAELTIQEGDRTEGVEEGTVEFRHVSFKYPDAEEYLLEDISFKAEKGQTVAFIGSTGSGKTTLINLIPRFYDATEGEVLVDGVNVREYKYKTLNNMIGYVPQKAVLFNGTVESNVAFGESKNKKDEDLIKKAIKVAQGKEFVENMEKQYKSHIAQSGTNISGGQKQRLAIARAIARNPEIFIFDDSFSALDFKTDAVLRKELKKHTKNATHLIVAQRIGTIMSADQIIVLEDGKCVGKGTHQELIKNCEVYKQIAESQLSKEELENV